MKFFIHPLNPHYSATFLDDVALGWNFGIWEHPYPAMEPGMYRVQSKHLEAAQEAKGQLEAATTGQPSPAFKGGWVCLPQEISPHSDAAARGVLQKAVNEGWGVRYEWTEKDS